MRPASRGRADNDWSVPWSGGCELCGTLGEFLSDRGECTLEWPLAEARRTQARQGQISYAELPVEHETWQFGNPYTLVLTKTDDLFRREAKARKHTAASLQWLIAASGR